MINRHLYRKTGSHIYIKQPTCEELDSISLLWADEETMKDVGGSIIF
ncbi:hypothetical protein KQI42_03935 [Tissierella sp. MSJ-40]|uniref:Uncharacterized protein n=1 Tax=Tissierella simiarum TaxID=2841534 RepID=A0ABS6E2K8_9FIRM|nr:hypothetical protein [Tissierella simiarum]MBU5437146.1 hypothetical protein [Tissierella simiarum]